jgi:small-conductance mechanosensitive channel
VAADEQIEQRLLRILETTKWFQEPQVNVDEGVVFLSGRTPLDEHKEWATQLAQNTQDVVAVVNRIDVIGRSVWDITPAKAEIRGLWRDTLQTAPMAGVALALLVLTWFAMWAARALAKVVLERRVSNTLLRQMAVSAVGVTVLILGLYLVLKISGLTRLAVTVLGGTGLAGLVAGLAFRDIAENFLASILLSMRRPFETGDLIEVAGNLGIVQAVTTRGTLLITFEGNHIHVPNSMIYKNIVNNFTANPNQRQDITVGIGYDDSIPLAQEVAIRVLREHPAVLHDPEPLVLVEQLGASTVVLKLYFWMNIRTHSMIKVRSAVIRLVKRAFQEAGISMPDEAREVIFPRGVPVTMVSADENQSGEAMRRRIPDTTVQTAEEQVSSHAEGGLASEADSIEAQARNSRRPDPGENLLKPESSP